MTGMTFFIVDICGLIAVICGLTVDCGITVCICGLIEGIGVLIVGIYGFTVVLLGSLWVFVSSL